MKRFCYLFLFCGFNLAVGMSVTDLTDEQRKALASCTRWSQSSEAALQRQVAALQEYERAREQQKLEASRAAAAELLMVDPATPVSDQAAGSTTVPESKVDSSDQMTPAQVSSDQAQCAGAVSALWTLVADSSLGLLDAMDVWQRKEKKD